MRQNCGNNVQDTSTAMGTLIDVWLNDCYTDISRRCNWSALIDDNFTFETVVDQATYTFSDLTMTDFEEELFMANIAQGYKLDRDTEGNWWTNRANAFQDDAIPSGTPYRYVILEEAASFKIDPAPSVAETYAMPYKKCVTLLTSDAHTVVIRDIEKLMEEFATGQALAYKRQYQKADWYLQRFEYDLRKRIGEERSKINQRYQMISDSFRTTGGIKRLTGDQSYDSL